MRTTLVLRLTLALLLTGCAAFMPSVSPSSSPGPAGPITYTADQMWALMSGMASDQRRAETLEGAVDFAELVVVGRYVGVERGGQYGSDSTAVALIAVDSIAKGEPKLGTDGLLRIEFILVVGSPSYPKKEFADLQRSIPKDPALLFLFTWESYMELIGGGLPAWDARRDLTRTYKTIGGDGAMRVVDGRIQPPAFVLGWPLTLRGSEIDAVLAEVRKLAASDSVP